jgi:hypothetical protein
VFSGKWIVDEFTPITGDHDASKNWDGPYFGANWGFSTDPHRCSSRETRWTAQFLLSRGRLNGVDVSAAWTPHGAVVPESAVYAYAQTIHERATEPTDRAGSQRQCDSG